VGYEDAIALNPSVIYCQTTMWGQQGPRRDWPGFDQLGQSSCGCEYELGGEGNPPVWYRFGMCDMACACQSAVAVLMALYWRDLTGQGQFVDTSILSGAMYFNSDVWIGEQGPFVRPRLDQQQTGISPLYRLYRTATEWIALVCVNDQQWHALTSVIDGLGQDARFADAQARADNGTALGAFLEERFASESAQTWFDRLDGAGVPVEIADPSTPKTWFDDPELVANGLVADYRHPEYGRFRQFGHLVHLSDTPGRIGGPPPLLGEHSVEVLQHLGYSPQEIDDLRAKAVSTWPSEV
jgi:crotonobetainyl-CoA:carnitine CoA-transferase CaiB-like acyl-CoA transferase